MLYYDIICNTMISYVLWYHRNNHDIIFNIMISHVVTDITMPTMISYYDVCMWYHMWYHRWYRTNCFHSATTGCSLGFWALPGCACTWYMISPTTSYMISFYDSTYDIIYNNIVWYHTIWFHIWYHIIWNHIWYHSMISHMISYKWYHMSGASVLMHRTYDISIWYHSIWYHMGVPFYLRFFGYPLVKKITKHPLMLQGLEPGLHLERQSLWPLNQWLTEFYLLKIISIIYIFWLRNRNVGASSAVPQCSPTPPVQYDIT